MKRGLVRSSVADAIIREMDLAGETKEMFLVGCGLLPGGEALLEEGLRRVGDAYAWADPRPHIARLHPPVAIVHGRDDDVIPYFEAIKIRAALRPNHPHELHLTGMYGHTGSALPSPRAIVGEVATMVRVLRLLAQAPVVSRHA
jgi:pimeloyl-ACP methyl ester carboxylesterase